MNDSTRKLGLMLQEKINEDKQLIEQAAKQSRKSIEDAQKQLENDLQRLSNAAKDTTESVTNVMMKHLTVLPSKMVEAINNTSKSAIRSSKAQIEEDTKRLIWMIRLPFLLLLIALLFVVLAAWIVTPTGLWKETTTTETMGDNNQYIVITSPNWKTCTINNRSYPCKMKE